MQHCSFPLPLCAGDAGDPNQLADQGQHQHYASQAQLAAGGWDQTGIPWDPSVPANQARLQMQTATMQPCIWLMACWKHCLPQGVANCVCVRVSATSVRRLRHGLSPLPAFSRHIC